MPDVIGISATNAIEACSSIGGLDYSLIGLLTDVDTISVTGKEITAIAMKTGKTFKKIQHTGKQRSLQGNLTEDSTWQYQTAELTIEGQSPTTAAALDSYASAGCLVLIEVYKSGTRRAIGIEHDGTTLTKSAEAGRLNSGLDTSGVQTGRDDKPRTVFGFSAEHEKTALFVDPAFDLAAITA